MLKRQNVPIEKVAFEFIERNGGPGVEVLSFLEDKDVTDFIPNPSAEETQRFEILKWL
eukprot:CAMPEP_0113863016 /NCGR_PEP_ID=MMETSP0372-20130328/15921_1 /TAXON_ID=340204 /ORGANISM="Lankesteria abbotti" /LENGTH=57 /DNA_ID=CAMNT_0000844809 /DNA_START=1 /DNA_END=171 /DNA_ORIENTATION=- /assembly_acc=CAM_ASM_000359